MTQRAVRERSVVDGLTAAEVQDRVARGLVNDVPQGPSRTTAEIIRSNVFTRFNWILSVMLVIVLMVAPPADALFGLVMIANTAIGIIQELRAKKTLDRLTLLTAPKARVVRDGRVVEMPVSDVVLDDVLELRPGDQVVVDGRVIAVRGLEVNESLLTGEAEPIFKQPGDTVLSGSFTVAGVGRCQATRVGADAYAVKLAQEARRFTLVNSELRNGIDWILAAVTWLMVPTVVLLVWSQINQTESLSEGLRGSIAGMVGMIPQGLVLLTSIAFAVAVVRLGRRNVLVQELPAVEGLARVDVICFDKTGTLTEGTLAVQEVETLDPHVDVTRVLGDLAASDPTPNATLLAIATGFPADDPARPDATVAFSSARKWSAASFAGRTWVLGAPEMVLPGDAAVIAAAERRAAGGQRVLLLAGTGARLDGERLPDGLSPAALVVLGDKIRADAADTVRYFAEQGVTAKVISGDHPHTVSAIAAQAGIPNAEDYVDARNLPTDDAELARVVEEATVFGRVAPHQKRAMVRALQAQGHTVAMTGDGVNDVLALKEADIGIAMGSGSSASRSVAQLVLIEGQFETLPSVVGEGRRVISNIERVANLFLTKTVYAFLLAIAVGWVGRKFPFLPRHLTLVGAITIGIPSFALALAPSARRAKRGFVRRVLRFAIPTGAASAIATFAAYELALYETELQGLGEDAAFVQASTMATIVLTAIGLVALTIVSRPLVWWRKALVATMLLSFIVVMASPQWRAFFELDIPRAAVLLAGVGIIAITAAVMGGSLVAVGWAKQLPEMLPELLGPENAAARRTIVPRFATDRIAARRDRRAAATAPPARGEGPAPGPPPDPGSTGGK